MRGLSDAPALLKAALKIFALDASEASACFSGYIDNPAMPDINEGKPWSQLDDDDLRLEVSTDETVDHAATFLCRRPDEGAKRAAEFGLRWAETLH